MVAPNTPPSTLTDEQVGRLLYDIDCMTEAEQMSNAALSDAAISAFMKLNGTDHWVLNELTKRFDKLAGLKRDEDTGELVI